MRETSAGTTSVPENTRSRLTVEISSSAALVAFVSPGQPGRTAANTYDFASGRAVAGDDPVNGTDPTGRQGQWPVPAGSPVSQLLAIWGIGLSAANAVKFDNSDAGEVYNPVYLLANTFGGICITFAGVATIYGNCTPSPDNAATLQSATQDIWEIDWAGLYSEDSPYTPEATGTSIIDGSKCMNGFDCWLDNVLYPSLNVGDAPDFTGYWWKIQAENLGYSVGQQVGLLDDLDKGSIAIDILGELAGTFSSVVSPSGGGSCT